MQTEARSIPYFAILEDCSAFPSFMQSALDRSFGRKASLKSQYQKLHFALAGCEDSASATAGSHGGGQQCSGASVPASACFGNAAPVSATKT